jgi:drug/metabolite transporter (DMT)-like permease
MNHNARAALLMMAAMASFTVNDAFSKWLTSDIGVGQTMLMRGVLATLILGVLAWRDGAFSAWPALGRPPVIGRSLLEVAGTVTFLLGLPHLPLSNASAIYQALPLVVTVGAVMFFAEPVGWRRWLAISAGFIGVMLIIQPGADGFNGWSVLMLVSVGFSAMRDLVTRRVAAGTSTMGVAMLTSALVTLTGAAMIPLEGGLRPVDGWHLGGLLATGMLIATAYVTLIAALRMGDVSFVAPFRYVALIFALVIGYFAFNEHPDQWMLAGSAIVVASGVYAFHRERVRAREARDAARLAAADMNE